MPLPDCSVDVVISNCVINLEPWRVYDVEDARAFLTSSGLDVDRVAADIEGRFASAFVRARKPEPAPCCGTDGCAG